MAETAEKRERWLNRIQQSRRRYFYERLKDLNRVREVNFFQLLEWTKNDILHSYKWFKNIIRLIRANGAIIQHNYGVSKIRQFRCMMYLAFVVKVYPANFIKYQLFKKKNWAHVNNFAYAHTKSQREFSEKICPQEVDLFLNKFEFFKFCKEYNIKTPDVLALYENGECKYWFDSDIQVPEEDLFIKKRSGMMGRGAKKLSYKNEDFIDKEGIRYKKDDVLIYLKTYSKKNEPVLLQKVIKNDPSWMKYSSGALATCRIVTYKSFENNVVKPLFCSLRMPHGSSDTDNFSGGGLAAPLNLKNGILGRAIAATSIDGRFEFSRHPDTNELIEGTMLPGWEELVTFAINIHRNVESVFVGWDVCLADDGLCVLEGSLVWGADVIEASNKLPLYDTDYSVLYEQTLEKHQCKVK